MANGKVVAICICPVAGGLMQRVEEVMVIAGVGLEGDRYSRGEGKFSEGKIGKRQVTLINSIFLEGTGFEFEDTRRNILVTGVELELNWLVGREFKIGEALMRGLKYCDPCDRPSKISGKPGFKAAFLDRGGLVAEILKGGMIRADDPIIPPEKGY